VLVGLASGLAYGLLLRALADAGDIGAVVGVMSLAFLVVVPFTIGFLTVQPHPAPSWLYRLFVPWLPVGLSVLASAALGWEGAICIIMGLPLLLLLASLGGIAGAAAHRAPPSASVVIAAVPLLLGPLENRWPAPQRSHRVETTIHVAASPAAVWREIVSVPRIMPAEQRPALFTRLGFPRPLSAELTGTGIGAVRHARFEGGVLFVETVTAWEVERHLRFTIAAQTNSIRPATLDPHVTIGGPYFDVLTGDYLLEPQPDGGTLLRLTSELRVSTHFNLYATPWADAIMRSIQKNILEVERQRAERRAIRS
jgi:hypothetical protein